MLTFFIAVLALLVVGLTAALIALSVAHVRTRRMCDRLNVELATALRDAQNQQSALAERKELDSLKDEFISTVSHELRTPLTSIRGALGLLSSGVMGRLDDKAANLLRIASTNTDRLVRLINDILDLERMESGRAPLHIRRCALHDLVQQAVDTMTALADASSVRLVIVPEGNTIVFDGDPDRFQQVLCNLLSNAIKFSPPGAQIRILTGVEGTNFILRVEDSGRGVPADKLESIFDRFQQVEPGDARQKGGTGLGLAICRSIIAQHGGSIWAERNDAHGSERPGATFSLRVPRVLAAAAATTIIPPVSNEGAILIVDDDSNARRILTELLARNGYAVLETSSGEQALSIAASEKVEAILLDLYMPGMSGWQTIERLKRNEATATIPIVVLSVLSPASGTRDELPLVAATQGWVQKPFNETLLLTELARVLHPGAGPGRVLLVEDDFDLATVVLACFDASESGMIISHVSSVGEAKLACRTDAPDLMILDLTLPDGSGFALVDWLRSEPTLRTMPLVVYSGRDVTANEMEQLRLGPTQFLAKARVQPRDVEDLVLAMVRHLRAPSTRSVSA